MGKWIIVLVLAIIILIFIFLPKTEQKEIIFNNIKLTVEVVKSSADQARGLSGRKDLGDNCGMLFQYDDLQIRHFWMHGMNFPLDMVWLDGGKVIGIAQNVPILDDQGQITRVSSPGPASAVLELKSGWIEADNLKIGDMFQGLD